METWTCRIRMSGTRKGKLVVFIRRCRLCRLL
jgi:hypothetical protein